ncbi:MAG: cytidine deaminase [Lachnospiraceae bacterium]|nr:cytidine deaminase [Lachnospiraceae bacterium]
MEIDKSLIQNLINEAFAAAGNAYCKYSGYHVGAALLTVNGKIFKGCNIENSSYGATNCAERTAIFKAVSEGERDFEAIAIVGFIDGKEPDSYAYPCGICRQVMSEFCDRDFEIIVAKSVNDYKLYTLNELLPESFGADNMI